MRHLNDGRKFGRNTSHRMAMFRNMANSVILCEQITTTTPKAKETRRVVDKLVTLAKRGTHHSRRLVFDRTRSKEVVEKLFGTLVERYKSRAGGYTRVLKLSKVRRGDGSDMAILELVDHPELDRKKKKVTQTDEATASPQTAKDALAAAKRAFSGSKKNTEKQTVKSSSTDEKKASTKSAPEAKPKKKAAVDTKSKTSPSTKSKKK